ncbi:hypothetical protein TREMEDRAFT_27944 [Tremella mesenterica DSM 1558]|uniref:uncharacterized protein n=1 Tax=Tremella mesenterica (strain ATCC 24925 / CBS 8224 / DSM 1558 / NBRC 9311 / NRRL Y-6157 / RJB 2259-6 / UBC 559-6) TaxID=578456 RepID=UPI0003F498C1|nr:uncharacterized protein TREMEDRAFT_27944 [Tremella mesenterica DSM 1558]EIW71520.1 hypothetical protein TREMEDRAFT_27944 [Tremella mesenterica DSM 1558]
MLASILFGILPLLTDASPVYKRYTSQRIQSVSQKGQCLSPVGWPNVTLSNGVQVGSVDCDQAPGWDISPGSGSVILSGTNYALDAGTGKDNNEIVKIWQSYPGLFQQTWYLTPDSRIAITGGNQCLDQGPVGPQTYQCTTGNTNQGECFTHSFLTCSASSSFSDISGNRKFGS